MEVGCVFAEVGFVFVDYFLFSRTWSDRLAGLCDIFSDDFLFSEIEVVL